MALTLRGDGTGTAYLVNSSWWNDYYNLLTGNMTDQPVTIANSISLSTQNALFRWAGTLAGMNREALAIQPGDAGTKHYGLYYNTSNNVTLYNATDNKVVWEAYPDGTFNINQGKLQNGGTPVAKHSNKWGANTVTISDVQPGSAVKGDVWIKTPFA